MVERVFLGEEVFQRRIAGQYRMMEKTDVATGRKRDAFAFVCRALEQHRNDPGVVAPGQQRRRDVADHAQRQGVQGLRPIQRDHADVATLLRHHQNLFSAHRSPRLLMPHASFSASVPSTSAPPASTCGAGRSLAPTHAQAMPKMISSSASKDISGAASERDKRTAIVQGIASWKTPSAASKTT